MDLNGRRLLRAARVGSLCEVWRLVRGEAALVHVQDDDGMTPLLWAAREGHVAVARLLLEHGACVNHMDCDGHSALLEACAHGRQALALMLIQDYHANVSFKDWQRGLSPLMAACDEDGHGEVVRCILRVRPQEAWERDWGGRTALWWACFWGAPPDVLSLLLHEGRADYSMPDHHGRTALDVATHGYDTCHQAITEAAAEGLRAYVLYKARRLTDLHHCMAYHHSPPRPLPSISMPTCPRAAVEGGGSLVVGGGGRRGKDSQGDTSPRGPATAGGEEWLTLHSQPQQFQEHSHSQGGPSSPFLNTEGHKGKGDEVLRAVAKYVVTSLPADLFHDLFQHLWYPLGSVHGRRTSGEGWHELGQQSPVTWHDDDWAQGHGVGDV